LGSDVLRKLFFNGFKLLKFNLVFYLPADNIHNDKLQIGPDETESSGDIGPDMLILQFYQSNILCFFVFLSFITYSGDFFQVVRVVPKPF
jgi:hypothetical protein